MSEATEEIKWPPAFSIECKCEPFTCRPEQNVDRYCWRSGCPIFAKDFPDTSRENDAKA